MDVNGLGLSGLNSVSNSASTANGLNNDAAKIAQEANKLESFQEKLLQANDDKELKEACDQFEEYFINLMLKEMQKTVGKDNSENSMFKESQAESITRDFLFQEYAKSMTEAGGIGLSKQMYEQMQKQNSGKVTTEQLLAEEE